MALKLGVYLFPPQVQVHPVTQEFYGVDIRVGELLKTWIGDFELVKFDSALEMVEGVSRLSYNHGRLCFNKSVFLLF